MAALILVLVLVKVVAVLVDIDVLLLENYQVVGHQQNQQLPLLLIQPTQ